MISSFLLNPAIRFFALKPMNLQPKEFNYPLHLGVTEAGTTMTSAIKSSLALGKLLMEGIGKYDSYFCQWRTAKKKIPIVKGTAKKM